LERVFFAEDAEDEGCVPEDVAVAALQAAEAASPPLSVEEAGAVRETYEAFPRRTRHVLTVRLGLGGEHKRILREVGDALGLHLSRVQQLQAYATDLLVEAVGEPKHARVGLRADVIEGLRLMAKGRVA
jgi:DNA-directed RNA polymerase sigma subunit (sigma70/sigma32)